MPTTEEILERGAATAERFVADSKAMDEAWKAGKYSEWFAEYAARERKDMFNGGSSSPPAQ